MTMTRGFDRGSRGMTRSERSPCSDFPVSRPGRVIGRQRPLSVFWLGHEGVAVVDGLRVRDGRHPGPVRPKTEVCRTAAPCSARQPHRKPTGGNLLRAGEKPRNVFSQGRIVAGLGFPGHRVSSLPRPTAADARTDRRTGARATSSILQPTCVPVRKPRPARGKNTVLTESSLYGVADRPCEGARAER
jgi:hypothetical protein